MEHTQKIIFSNDVSAAIDEALSGIDYNKAFVLTDENTHRCVLSRVLDNKHISQATNITIPAGDVNKTIDNTVMVWRSMTEGGGTRRSVLLNLGGGVVTDLGGFAASTFKRGIRFVNIPTTLLSAVDAAVGGKTGVNLDSYKNEVGAFCEADAVIISTKFFDTLPDVELRSGFAEMLKHGLLKGAETYDRLLAYDLSGGDEDRLLELLKESVEVKSHIVAIDPQEKGLRRALNLGHTAGHAFESLALRRKEPIPHGYAVVWGLVVELTLSHLRYGFPGARVEQLAAFVRENYGAFHITCDDYDEIISLIGHDKKSENGEMNFSLLADVGDIRLGCVATADEVRTSLDIYRDLTHQ